MKAADEEGQLNQIVEMSHSEVGDGGVEDPGLECPRSLSETPHSLPSAAMFLLSFSYSMGGVKRILSPFFFSETWHMTSNFHLVISLFNLDIFKYLGIVESRCG